MEHFRYGIKQEDRLAAALRRRGHDTGYYDGSRGAIDVTADKGGRHLDIQVKAVRSGSARITDEAAALDHLNVRLSKSHETRLMRSSHARGRQAAVALVNGNYFWLWRLTKDSYELLHDGWLPP